MSFTPHASSMFRPHMLEKYNKIVIPTEFLQINSTSIHKREGMRPSWPITSPWP
jgi:hypothetical protein